MVALAVGCGGQGQWLQGFLVNPCPQSQAILCSCPWGPPQLSEDLMAPSWHLPTLSAGRFWLMLSLIPATPFEVSLSDITREGEN